MWAWGTSSSMTATPPLAWDGTSMAKLALGKLVQPSNELAPNPNAVHFHLGMTSVSGARA